MIGPSASPTPYVIASPVFRFRALAALAGRSALGGQREVALATYLMARLAQDCHASKALAPATRAARAQAARGWLSSVALPAGLRAPLTRVADATQGDANGLATALRAAFAAAAPYLDAAARAELERLAHALT